MFVKYHYVLSYPKQLNVNFSCIYGIIYFKHKIEFLVKRKGVNMPGCNNCSALKYCAGYCLGEVANESDNLFVKKPQICEPVRYLHAKTPEELRQYKSLNPQTYF